jgi:hypothetical protein
VILLRWSAPVAYFRVPSRRGSIRVPVTLAAHHDLIRGEAITTAFSRRYGRPAPGGVRLYLSDRWHLRRSEWDEQVALTWRDQRGALAFGSTGNGTSDFATSLTYSFTNTSGDFMWVLCANDRSGSGTTIDNITYAAAGLTLQTALGAGGRATRMGHKIAPATGANNVVQTNSSINTKPMSMAISYTGADQTTPVSGVQTFNTTATDSTWTVTSASGDFVCAGAITTTAGQAFTPGTDTNERLQVDFTSGSGFMCDEPGATSITINETHSSAVTGGYGFSLKAAGAGGASLTPAVGSLAASPVTGSFPLGFVFPVKTARREGT